MFCGRAVDEVSRSVATKTYIPLGPVG